MTSLLQQLNQVLNTKQKVKIDSEKVILLQNQVISVLKKQIAILRNVITRHAKKQDINKNNHPTEDIYSQMGSQAVQLSQLPVLKVQNQRLSTEISSKKKKIQQILNIADCSWDQIEQYIQKLKNTERKPIFIEKIKQKQVPIIVQKIKQVQIIVPIEIKKQIITPIMIELWNEVKGEQRIIEVIKYIEKEVPIFKEKIVHKYLPPPGSSRRPLICVQTQTQ